MNLTRCSCQGRETFEEFCASLPRATSSNRQLVGDMLLGLIQRLRAHPDERTVFGLTSLDRLCLLAGDDYTKGSFILIAAMPWGDYQIEYFMPEEEAPWPGASVKGVANSEDEAFRMILVGMEIPAAGRNPGRASDGADLIRW